MNNTLKLLTAAFALLLYGCSSTSELQMTKAPSERIDHAAVAALDVKPHQGVEETADLKRAMTRLRGELFGRLVSEGVFKQVVHAGESAKYRLNATLLAAYEVSQGARIFFGVLAGSNELAVKIDLVDSTSGALVSSFTAKGTSASHPLSSEAHMDDAIREVVDEVILALR